MSTDLLDRGTTSSKPKEDLSNANAVLTTGIISIVLSIIPLGLIFSIPVLMLGIYAITKGRQCISLFKDYPNDYTASSLSKAKAGFVCGIIGVCIWGLWRLLIFAVFMNL